jgi:hypothetical protein
VADAAGEVAALKDNLNEMIRNLRETTDKTPARINETNGEIHRAGVRAPVCIQTYSSDSRFQQRVLLNEGPENGEAIWYWPAICRR